MRGLQKQALTRRLGHLVARFIDVLTSPGWDAAERAEVEGWLQPAEREAFFAQPRADQRHGRHAALLVAKSRPRRIDLIRAALLHDIGKRHAELGVIGRSLATIWKAMGGPCWGRWALYHQHGALGADELARMRSESLVVTYARYHHSRQPETIPSEDWRLLVASDRARPLRFGPVVESRPPIDNHHWFNQ